MPNLIALAMLVFWPAVTAVLWHKLPAGRALLATLIAGYLFLPPLPAAIDLPILPPFSKDNIPAICAAIMALALYRKDLELLPRSPAARILIAVFVFSPVATILTNSEPLSWGPIYLPGLNPREAISSVIAQIFTLLPLLLGRHFLTTAKDQRDLLFALMLGGLVYSLPVLIEIRLSPQLNLWIYGYFQHLFEQMMRGSGFRPIVFLYHALWVSFYMMTAVVAAAALSRGEAGRQRLMFWGAAGFLFVVLFLSKSYAALFYAIALVPVVLLVSQLWQIRLAMVMAAVALIYPMAKANQFVPEEAIVALAGRMGPDRAHTLKFRFDNETVLADRALQKPLFGWGIWGRHHIYDTSDGRVLTITDGRWVLVLGVLGLVGFLAEFGLMALPVLMLWWQGRRAPPDGGGQIHRYAAPLALILGVNMFDLIPNATITQLTWLAAGAILGHVERVRSPAAQGAPDSPTTLAAAPWRIKTVF